MVKVTFEKKVIFSLYKVKKKFYQPPSDFFFVMRVIVNKQFFKAGLVAGYKEARVASSLESIYNVKKYQQIFQTFGSNIQKNVFLSL